jgi:hypothetical protein
MKKKWGAGQTYGRSFSERIPFDLSQREWTELINGLVHRKTCFTRKRITLHRMLIGNFHTEPIDSRRLAAQLGPGFTPPCPAEGTAPPARFALQGSNSIPRKVSRMATRKIICLMHMGDIIPPSHTQGCG